MFRDSTSGQDIMESQTRTATRQKQQKGFLGEVVPSLSLGGIGHGGRWYKTLLQPHPEVRWEGWEHLPHKARESNLQIGRASCRERV